MNHARRTLTTLAALATAGALTFGTTGAASADVSTAASLSKDRERTAVDADGQAEARVQATRKGALSVFGKTRGGGEDGILGNPTTLASATASVTKRTSVADGTYRVIVKYQGAKGTDRDRNDGDADLRLRSTVSFGGGQTLNRTTDLSQNRKNRSVRFTYKVPNDQSGRLKVRAALAGNAEAESQGDNAKFNGSVRGVDITVKRIGN